jgi:glutathione S-transferase
VIVLRTKQVEFDVTYINLRDKPDWFLKISPRGKVPVLTVDGTPLFESNAIAEYLDETVPPRLHPAEPLKRARHRAWTDFVPDFAPFLSALYYRKTRAEVEQAIEEAPGQIEKLERALAEERGNDGPYFAGGRLCLVDAAYAPFLQRFAFVEARLKSGVFKAFPLVQAWCDALLASELVTGSVAPSFEAEFVGNLQRRDSYAWSLFRDWKAAAAE